MPLSRGSETAEKIFTGTLLITALEVTGLQCLNTLNSSLVVVQVCVIVEI